MTLVMVSHRHTQRVLQEQFNGSMETINRNVHKVLLGLCRFAATVIRPYDHNNVHPRIANSKHFYPWFQGAVGALDGTHIPVCPPSEEQMAYTNRYGIHSQNVLAVCDFDMRFNYIYAGWEGSAHDARVLESALMPPSDFSIPPSGKYYLVDGAYRNTPGFLPPYKNVRKRDPAKRPKLKYHPFLLTHEEREKIVIRAQRKMKARIRTLTINVGNWTSRIEHAKQPSIYYLRNFSAHIEEADTLNNYRWILQDSSANIPSLPERNLALARHFGGSYLLKLYHNAMFEELSP
nr:putative nuclease HARBI1 [Coffea arabica]